MRVVFFKNIWWWVETMGFVLQIHKTGSGLIIIFQHSLFHPTTVSSYPTTNFHQMTMMNLSRCKQRNFPRKPKNIQEILTYRLAYWLAYSMFHTAENPAGTKYYPAERTGLTEIITLGSSSTICQFSVRTPESNMRVFFSVISNP